MRERANELQLKKATIYLAKDFENIEQILQIQNEDDLNQSDNIYLAKHY